jgi:AcrR family transcriptional regulator
MSTPRTRRPTGRREDLLEQAYDYVKANGMAQLSLRPLATAIGTSPGVLLFLFGSKDGLVTALLARARADEVQALTAMKDAGTYELPDVAEKLWTWLASPDHRALLRLWVESYAQSLVDASGPRSDFARATVRDWLTLLADAQPPQRRASAEGEAERTLVLAVLRGGMLDLLATEDEQRVGDAVLLHVRAINPART